MDTRIDPDPTCSLPIELETPPNVVRAMAAMTVKAKNDQEREILHLITTAATDRAGDVVVPKGADMSNFMRNPVVLVDHGYSVSNVVGRAVSLTVDDSGISARTRFRDTPLARDAYKLAAEGMGGWSIGFRPIEFAPIKDDKGRTKGFTFSKWELLEYSLVAIPMNQEIVNNAVKRGLVSPEHVRSFFVAQAPAPSQEVSHRSSARVAKALDPGIQKALKTFAFADVLAEVEATCKGIGNGK